MPTPEHILRSLEYLANNYMAIGVMWHVIIILLLTFYIPRKQVSSRLYYGVPALLFLSVSLLALTILNFFNALVYFGLSVLFLRKSIITGDYRFEINKSFIFRLSAFTLILSGLIYPHFIDANLLVYIIASPTGVIPCPTLLLASGISLLFVHRDHKSVFYILIAVNLIFGFIGIFVLGVYIDILLIAASSVQLVYVLLNNGILKISQS